MSFETFYYNDAEGYPVEITDPALVAFLNTEWASMNAEVTNE